jgi:hypothetical protein
MHTDTSISSCRNCRYYVPQGRRGGQCNKLNVAVKSGWDACSLAASPFVPPWNDLSDIMLWQQKALGVQEIVAMESGAGIIRELERLDCIEPSEVSPLGSSTLSSSPLGSIKGGNY